MPRYTSDPTATVDIQVDDTGAGSLHPITLITLFKESLLVNSHRPALAVKRKDSTSACVCVCASSASGACVCASSVTPQWQYWTLGEYWDLCLTFGKSMLALGLQPFAVVNILGFNSPEWLIANNGCVCAGGIPAGIYITSTPDACHYISEHSKANLVIVDSNEQLQKYASISEKLPHLKAIVVWGCDVDPMIAKKCSVPVYHWDHFMTLGAHITPRKLNARMEALRPGNCVSLIYTSGTTGPPKAVMLSHDNVTWSCKIFANQYVTNGMVPGKVVSYLPLSHVAAQMIDINYTFYSGSCCYFAQTDALKGSLSTTLKEVRPSVFFGVPRVWEKMEEKLKEIGKTSTGLKKTIADWAKSKGTEHCEMLQFGNSGSTPWGYGLANAVVLSKVKEALGLDQCNGFFTAAAPINLSTLQYFASLDIPVHELFGQSECTGPHTSSKFGSWKMGYCGRPLPGTRTEVIPETGELTYTGRHIFMGYMYMPEKTAESFTKAGYLISGDVVEFDGNNDEAVPPPSGFMRITGRIKDIIITAGGENIPPILIEEAMKDAMPALSNVVVIGDKKKYLTMLISLKVEVDPDSGCPTDKLSSSALSVSADIGSTATTTREAMKDEKWIAYINAGVQAANSKTASRAQFVQKWAFLPKDLSENAGEMTPTLKMKRNVINKLHADLINSMYA